ncbi:GTPase HflX [Candidatus Chlorohelix sp.]|uniref:GTPase HflX n=1 Tax=Candidatus Chlorohelix sp. TaxID=3139201 RepID=UPI00306505C2
MPTQTFSEHDENRELHNPDKFSDNENTAQETPPSAYEHLFEEPRIVKPKRSKVPVYPTGTPQEKALLVGVGQQSDLFDVEDSLLELEQLCDTDGVAVIGKTSQKISTPNRSYFIGKGKLHELKAMRESMEADVVIFDVELSPTHQREVEEYLGVKVIDRTALILDIFAKRARTKEGRLQVELAQLEYRLPRLTRMWTHLSRQTGGGVGLRGPGETQLEIDRRASRTRISYLKEQLEHVHNHRELYRERRRTEEIPVVSLVGYTNAGKSTLLNKLSNADVLAEDKLFATLDPTTRRVKLPNGRDILLTDTVGFIQRLPHGLVEAFRSTLEEVNEADLLIHVLDFTHQNAQEQAQTVEEVLKELGASDKPRIMALNKIDLMVDLEDTGSRNSTTISQQLSKEFELPDDYVPVSAQTGIGLDQLLIRIQHMLDVGLVKVKLNIPYSQNKLVALFHQKGHIDKEQFLDEGTHIEGRIPAHLEPMFRPYTFKRAS